MVEIDVIEQWVSIVAGITTVAIIFLLWRTVREMQETTKFAKIQVTHRFRPWIGPSGGIEFVQTTPEGKHQYAIKLKNYGELPSTNVLAMFTMRNEMPARDVLKNSNGIDRFNLGPLLPYMEKSYWFFIDPETMQKVKDGKTQIFIALYFAYEFPSGKNGYGMISYFDPTVNTFVHKDMWVD